MVLYFRNRKDLTMGISIAEYAAAVGISNRAARMRAEQGRIEASRVGHVWIVAEHELGDSAKGKDLPGRPVSRDSFERLAAFLDGKRAQLSPDQRRQAKRLAARLVPDDNAKALRAISRRRGGVPHPFRGSDEDLEALRQDPVLQLAGVSDQENLSGHGLLEAYVQKGEDRRLRAIYGLSPASHASPWNVLLRVIDHLPPNSQLRTAADLLDARDPRSVAEASRIAQELAKAAL